MAYPETMINIGGAGVSMATKKGQDVIDPIVANVSELTAQVPTFSFSDFTAGIVVNDADFANSYTPTSGTNPTLGTGSVAVGRYFQIGKLVVANFAIHFGTSGVVQGSGTYRVKIPVRPSATLYNANAVIGWGHIIDHNALNAFGELGPGATKHVTFHVTSSVNNKTAGVVIGTNPTSIAPSYTITSPSTDRTYNPASTTTTELGNVIATLIGDIDASRGAGTIFDNASAGIPWTWDTEDKIVGCLMYEAG